ncbi:hypothetical protein [Pseudomonas capsici]|uniref:hypothetical protein n=1 Tax=Pseudomonas capsici TaxID=2810614 RepID=UPI0021F0D78E|nr:hypothetical protein [Pseudomonas capsici]MCV4285125.1 hypothetical protein [Pseudomonas capsici]
MQAKKTEMQFSALDQATEVKRQTLKLSDLDQNTLSDFEAMFGLWKEADHCDKDLRD